MWWQPFQMLTTSSQIHTVKISLLRYRQPEMEFKEFVPRFKSVKTRFKLSAGLNHKTFDTILCGTNHI